MVCTTQPRLSSSLVVRAQQINFRSPFASSLKRWLQIKRVFADRTFARPVPFMALIAHADIDDARRYHRARWRLLTWRAIQIAVTSSENATRLRKSRAMCSVLLEERISILNLGLARWAHAITEFLHSRSLLCSFMLTLAVSKKRLLTWRNIYHVW